MLQCLASPEDYLAKEESTAGAHGVETRYPFLDRNLVQEFLWLSSDAWAHLEGHILCIGAALM